MVRLEEIPRWGDEKVAWRAEAVEKAIDVHVAKGWGLLQIAPVRAPWDRDDYVYLVFEKEARASS